MTEPRKPKVIVELREQFHRENEPTEEMAARVWEGIERAQDREEGRWHIEHAGSPAKVPAKLSVGDVALWVAAIGILAFAFCGGQL